MNHSKDITPHPKALYGWVIFAISVLYVFYKYILEVSPSILTNQIRDEFHVDEFIIGHIGASYYYAYAIMQLPSGLLVDTFGPRRTTTLGILCCSLGALLFGYSQSIFMMSFSRFLMGLGATFAILNTFKLNSNWFPSHRFAFLAGVTLTLGTLGAVFGQNPLEKLVNTLGWRQSFIDIALFGIAFALLFFILVRDKPPHRAYDVTPPTKGKVKIRIALLHIIRRSQTWIVCLYSGLSFTPVMSFAGLWGVQFIMVKYHLSKSEASFLTSLIFIGFAIGAPFYGWLSSYIGKRKPIMFLGSTISLILLTLVIYLPPLPYLLFASLLCLTGFFISGFLLSFSVIHEINVPLMTATAVGIMNTFNALFGAITGPLIGFFLDFGNAASRTQSTLGDYNLALLVLPAYLLTSLILLFFIRETNCIQTLEDKE